TDSPDSLPSGDRRAVGAGGQVAHTQPSPARRQALPPQGRHGADGGVGPYGSSVGAAAAGGSSLGAVVDSLDGVTVGPAQPSRPSRVDENPLVSLGRSRDGCGSPSSRPSPDGPGSEREFSGCGDGGTVGTIVMQIFRVRVPPVSRSKVIR